MCFKSISLKTQSFLSNFAACIEYMWLLCCIRNIFGSAYVQFHRRPTDFLFNVKLGRKNMLYRVLSFSPFVAFFVFTYRLDIVHQKKELNSSFYIYGFPLGCSLFITVDDNLLILLSILGY